MGLGRYASSATLGFGRLWLGGKVVGQWPHDESSWCASRRRCVGLVLYWAIPLERGNLCRNKGMRLVVRNIITGVVVIVVRILGVGTKEVDYSLMMMEIDFGGWRCMVCHRRVCCFNVFFQGTFLGHTIHGVVSIVVVEFCCYNVAGCYSIRMEERFIKGSVGSRGLFSIFVDSFKKLFQHWKHPSTANQQD